MTINVLQKQFHGEIKTLQKTQYFCDRCSKEVPVYRNGSIKPHLYLFRISNNNNFKDIDKDGYGFELCNECAELFSMLIADFCKVSEKTDTYRKATAEITT